MKEQLAYATTPPSGLLADMIMQAPQEDASREQAIETRFGLLSIPAQKPVCFRKGMLGMPDMTRFCLVSMPGAKWEQFRLLQSLDDQTLSFIALPVDLDNPIVSREDLETAAGELGIDAGSLSVMLIVSVHRDGDKIRVSANARAPIFVNLADRSAEQYVLRNTRYMVRHMISAA